MKPVRDLSGTRRLEEEAESFREIGARLLDGVPLASNVKLGTEGDVTITLALDDCGYTLNVVHVALLG